MKPEPEANNPQRPTGVAVQRVVSLRGWTFTAWKSHDPSYEEWQGVGRKKGKTEIVTHAWHTYRKDAIADAKSIATEREQAATENTNQKRK